MEERHLTCIRCPLGCQITVTLDQGEVVKVVGNTCKRGDEYARKEVTNPTRTVTSIVRVTGGDVAMVSVKTRTDVPKDKIFDVLILRLHDRYNFAIVVPRKDPRF